MFNYKPTDRFSTLAHCLTSRPLLSAGLLSAIAFDPLPPALVNRELPAVSAADFTMSAAPSAIAVDPMTQAIMLKVIDQPQRD